MTGSHIDTVRTGGRFDGNLGVLAGLEVLETLIANEIETERGVAVGFFTDEEGARFAPDMLGSLVFVGGLALETALDITAADDGARLGDELARIGYAGPVPCPSTALPNCYVELHIEQGPILEDESVEVGVVTGVQGISWTELVVTGQSNHAGTTPMTMRHDAGYTAGRVAVFVRDLVEELGPPMVGTVGRIDLHPNLTNVVAARATLTVDMRHTDNDVLARAEKDLMGYLVELAYAEGVQISWTTLARFEPVVFDADVVELVDSIGREHGHTVMQLPSGAGHDAQMLARVCPAGMVFVPSANGISHNPAEHTDDTDLEAGANVLLHCLLRLARAS
jgi:N-carbamoyl-L-amino-acid hydrolase